MNRGVALCALCLLVAPILGAEEQPGSRAPATKEACEAIGGQWGLHGEFVKEFCVRPAADEGKLCQDGAECEGQCIAELTPEEKRLLSDGSAEHHLEKSGRCSPWEAMYGCYPFVEKGIVSEILCVE